MAKLHFLLKKKKKDNRNTSEGNGHNKIASSNLLFLSIIRVSTQLSFCDICTE